VEKVNAKKVDLNPIISIKNGMCPYFKRWIEYAELILGKQ
jgi:hypothetical protein